MLDARESQDPDYPTPEGQTFRGNFEWFCKNPSQLPCFDVSSTSPQVPVSARGEREATRVENVPLVFF